MSELIQLDSVGNILSNIGNKLIQNQNLLKCIKYDTSDALSESDIGIQGIVDLVGKGTDPKTQQRIYKYPFNNNIVDETRSELRFFIPKITPNNIYVSELQINFQIVIYNTLIELDDNKFRFIVMIQEILNSLNGFSCGGIGLLYLKTPINIVTWSDNFSGYTFSLCTRTV